MAKIITRTRDEVYHLWVDALRSGEYHQAQGCLHNPRNYIDDQGDEHWKSDNNNSFQGGFCCLGVLCDLAVKDGGAGWDTPDGPVKSYGEPPDKILDFMGLDQEMVDELVDMNDKHKMTFSEIADVIEQVIMPALDVK